MANKKLLTIHLGALGDVVTSFTAILHLKKTYDQVDLVCQQSLGHMARYLGIIDCSFGIESASFSCLFAQNTENFHIECKNWLGSYDDIVLFCFSKLLAQHIKKISGKRVIQIPPRPAPTEPIHVGRYLISQLVETSLLKKESETHFLHVHRDFRTSTQKNKKIFMHPGSGSPMKNWPIQFFFKLEQLLSDDGFEPVYILGPAEEKLFHFFPQNKQPMNQHIYCLSEPNELVELLITGAGFIGNDSGASHLSAFLGLPTLAIFGPTDPSRWTPAGCQVETICHRPKDCDPCFESLKKGCNSMECLTNITPKQVLEKFKRMTG